MDRIDGDCSLTPMERAVIVTEIPGLISQVLVREGDHVKAGDPVAKLDTHKLDTELQASAQEASRYRAEAERARALGDEGAATIAFLQASVAEENMKKITADIASATLRSRIDGVILTKDLELRVGEQLQPGTPFAEVASLESWEAQLDLNEKKIGLVEKKLGQGNPVAVSFILYSQSSHTFGQLCEARADQFLQAVLAREGERVSRDTEEHRRAAPTAMRPDPDSPVAAKRTRPPAAHRHLDAAHLELVS
jgi:multidrug resistance efflux pump